MNTESFSIDPSSGMGNPRSLLVLALFAIIPKSATTFLITCLVVLAILLLGAVNAYRPQALMTSLDEALRSTKRTLYQAMDEADGTRDLTEFTTQLRRLQCTAAGLRKRSLQASVSWRAEMFSLFSGLIKNLLVTLEDAKKLQARIEIVKAEEEQRRLTDQ